MKAKSAAVPVFKTEWFTIDAVPYKPAQPYYRLSCADSVEIIASTEAGELVVVRQFRPAIDGDLMEFPSGHVDEGETPDQAARRELMEESGYDCRDVRFLGWYNDSPSRINNRVGMFFGSGARLRRGGKVDKDIRVELASPARLDRMIARGRFTSVSGIGFYYLAKVHRLI